MKVSVNGKLRTIPLVFDNTGQDITSDFLNKMLQAVKIYNFACQSHNKGLLDNHIGHKIPPSEIMNNINYDGNKYSMSEDAFKWWEAYALKHNEVSSLEKKVTYEIQKKNDYFLKLYDFDSVDINGVTNYKCELLRSFAESEGIDVSDIMKAPYLPEKSVWKEMIKEDMEDMIEEDMIKKDTKEEEKTMAKAKYTDKQVAMFQKFIRAGFDIEGFKNPKFNEKQLKELYLALKSNINISLYAYPEVSAEEMKALRKSALAEVDLQEIAEAVVSTGNYNKEQTLQILDAAKHGVSFKNMLNPEFDYLQMRQIKLGERYGIDTSVYATTDFTYDQMQKLRLELTVQKVIEKIKEFFKEKWNQLLEWAKHKVITPETAEEIKELVSAKSPNGIAKKYLSDSALNLIAAKVYDKVSAQILAGENNLESETIVSTTDLAEKASNDIIREEQIPNTITVEGKWYSEETVKTVDGDMPLEEYQDMIAYQQYGYDSYSDMQAENQPEEASPEEFEPEM